MQSRDIFWHQLSKKTRVERGYKIKADKVLDDPFISRRDTLYNSAGILVENSGRGDIKCIAKLAKVVKLNEKDGISVDVKEINPNGYYLRWDDGAGACIIKEHRARKINLADAYEERGFFRQGRLLFENGYSRPIEAGRYRISIDILRISGKQQVLMSTVEGVLGIHMYFNQTPSPIYGEGLHVLWMENKKRKRKTQQ